jgi:hypothetical protein
MRAASAKSNLELEAFSQSPATFSSGRLPSLGRIRGATFSSAHRPAKTSHNSSPQICKSERRPEIASADCDLTTPIPSSTNNPSTQSRWYVCDLFVSSVSAVARIPPPNAGDIATQDPRRPRKHHSNNVSRPQVRYAATEIESAKSARARGSYLRVSFKNTRETAQAINGWKVTRALQYLENVKGHAEAVPMRRYAGSTGRTAQGT